MDIVNSPGFINLVHILVVAPLFWYIAMKKCDVPDWIYTSLQVLAVIIVLYHGYRWYSTMQ